MKDFILSSTRVGVGTQKDCINAQYIGKIVIEEGKIKILQGGKIVILGGGNNKILEGGKTVQEGDKFIFFGA